MDFFNLIFRRVIYIYIYWNYIRNQRKHKLQFINRIIIYYFYNNQ